MTRLLSAFCCITAIIFACTKQSDNYIEGYISTLDGTQIFYQKFGNGPDAIINPGGMYLSHEFKQLASKNRTLVFYDQRSRGKSEMINDKSKLSISYELSRRDSNEMAYINDLKHQFEATGNLEEYTEITM